MVISILNTMKTTKERNKRKNAHRESNKRE